MEFLGHLVWWSIGSPEVTDRQVRELMAGLSIQAPPPNPVIPIDAFRRLTGGTQHSYVLEGGEVVKLDLHAVNSQKTMLVRHIVRTTSRDGVVQSMDRVGDCAFYRPPRGQPHRARMRVTIFPESMPDREQIEAFADELRAEYRRSLTFLDPQALRRLVRQYLVQVNGLYLNGPYFVPVEEHAELLCRLLTELGGGNRCQTVPVVDDEPRRQMISAALEAAAQDGLAAIDLVEAYAPLGVVPESVWNELEHEQRGETS